MLLIRQGRLVHSDGGEEETVDPADPFALLPHLGDMVAFAPDLTSAGLARALRPWSPSLSLMLGRDLDPWLAEMGRGQVRPAAAAPHLSRDDRIDAVEVHPLLSTSPDRDGVDLRVEWDVVGIRYGGTEPRWALPGDPFAWVGLPLVLCDVASFQDIGRASPFVPGRVVRVEPTFVDAVVFGFLAEVTIYGSPDQARDADRSLSALAEGLRHGGHGLDAPSCTVTAATPGAEPNPVGTTDLAASRASRTERPALPENET